MGLVNHVFRADRFKREINGYVMEITGNCPGSISSAKEIIDSTAVMTETDALDIERKNAVENVLRGDCIEGIGAFLEKRKPNWVG